jgi:hypothetical protein
MISVGRFCRVLLPALLMTFLPAADDVPNIVHYQGRATQSGTGITGSATVTASIINSGSASVWSATYANVPLIAGLFNVRLGDISGGQPALPTGLFGQAGLKLRLSIDTGSGPQVIAPDLELASTPYALQAQQARLAEAVVAQAVGSDQLADGAVTRAKLGFSVWSQGGDPLSGEGLLGSTTGHPLGLIVDGRVVVRLVPTTADDAANMVSAETVIAPGVVGVVAFGGDPNTQVPDGGGGYLDGSNRAFDHYATISGGADNQVGSDDSNLGAQTFATIAGGFSNRARENGSTVGGGAVNQANVRFTTVAGGYFNTASGIFSTIGGGAGGIASGGFSVLSGGENNVVSGENGTLGGGEQNAVSGDFSTLGGGDQNTASGERAVLAGGSSNTASGDYSVVGGGSAITAGGHGSVVMGGYSHVATGDYSTVAGGYGNLAVGAFSFVAGRNATNVDVNHPGCFVFSDSSFAHFLTTTANSFSVRSVGGARFVTAIDVWGTPTAGVALDAGGTSWASLSDRRRKFGMCDVDLNGIMDRVRALPVTTWHYDWESDRDPRHMGPMAQDFKQAFYPGRDVTTISTQEADGVHFAAIKGLATENDRLRARIAAIEAEKAAMNERLERLEKLVAQLATTSDRP